jgi:uncharacterized repeat protein (TIGR01451 family)/LPXTG-motif cell wall-anchored protein
MLKNLSKHQLFSRKAVLDFVALFAIISLIIPLSLPKTANAGVNLDVVFDNGTAPPAPMFDVGDFKPGDTITKWAKITNKTTSNQAIVVKLANYIDNNIPRLGDQFDVVIKEHGAAGNLFSNTMTVFAALTQLVLNPSLAPDVQTQYDFSVTFRPEAGNPYQEKTLSFDFDITLRGADEGGGGDGVLADLAVVKTVDKASISAGDSIIYNVTVHNLGPDTAHNVVVTDAVPATINFISATPAQGSYSTTTGQWIIGTLDVGSGSSTVLTITGTVGSVTPSQVVVNTASVTAADEADSNLSNNTSSATSAVPGSGGCVSNCGGGTSSGGGSYTYSGGGGTSGSGSGATISGQKFNDLNLNGKKDTGDLGLPGWLIYLDFSGNKLLDTGEPYTITNAQGSYTFSNVSTGPVHIREVGQSNWAQTLPGQAKNFEYVVDVASGGTYSGMDFGNSLARIGGAFTNVPNTPQTLGATAGLPKTGIPPVAWLYLALVSLAGGLFLARRREPKP